MILVAIRVQFFVIDNPVSQIVHDSLNIATAGHSGHVIIAARELFTGIISPAGISLDWDATDQRGSEGSSGIYFINVRTASVQKTLKIVKLQ